MTVYRFEFADSEVAAAWRRDDEIRDRPLAELALRLSAAQVMRSDDAVLSGFVRGHMRAVELVFSGPALPTPGSLHLGRLAQGRIAVDGSWQEALPLPAMLHGPLQVELDFANGARFDFAADRLCVVLPDHPAFVESMAC